MRRSITDSQKLSELRSEIDLLNKQILASVQRRGSIVLEIAALKRAEGLPGYDPRREDEILESLASSVSGPFGAVEVREIFQAILRASLYLQDAERRKSTRAVHRSLLPAGILVGDVPIGDLEPVVARTSPQHPNGPREGNMDKPSVTDRLSTTRRAAGEATSARDQIFAAPEERIADFDFGAKTAAVFDDMLGRSVPFYGEIQRMTAELAADYAAEGSAIYDLGCSTGTTILQIGDRVPRERNVRYVGVDNSPEMIEKARRKLTESEFDRPYELECVDLNNGVRIDDASVVLMVLTLQFIRPLYRHRMIKNIYDGLRENGALILVEKVLGENSEFNRLFIHHYYEMKRENGYSDLEIAQKREALENILVPYRLEENKELLREQGFRHVDVFFKWYNFCAIIATK